MAKVLIVDVPDSCDSLTKILQAAGHHVTFEPNGREALAHVIMSVPDVVVLDLLMPETDCLAFLEVVRSYLRLQSLPVVVKGKASLEEIKQAVEGSLGVNPARCA